MAERPIRIFGDPVLTTPTDVIGDIDDGVRALVADLLDTVRDPDLDGPVVVGGSVVVRGTRVTTFDGRKVLAIDAQGLLVQGSRGPERLWLLSGTPKQAAGTIVHSQSARYQPAPAASPTNSPAPGRRSRPGGPASRSRRRCCRAAGCPPS